jgi:deoxyribonuclease IV
MRLGNHTSKSGSLENAALKCAEIGGNTFQIFSSSPRTWRSGTPDPADIRKLEAARSKHDLYPLVVHSNYLINLAATEGTIRTQSIAAFRSELERSIAIGADYVVVHPGSYRGRTCEEGIVQVVDALIQAADGLHSKTTAILLENTAGAGCHIGGRFEELAAIRHFTHKQVRLRIGFCMDTCHCLASNYDVSTADGLRETIRRIEATIGLENVHVIHTNDSKYPLGSHVDRHANIGEGYIGIEGFRRILSHPKLRSKPFILETPVDEPGDDRRNLETLKSLCRKSSTTTAKSS